MEGGGGGDTGPPRLDMGAGGLCFWGCNPGLPKKKKKKRQRKCSCVLAGRGELRNTAVGLIYCFVLPLFGRDLRKY